MKIDMKMLRGHVDSFLASLKTDQGIHVDSIVNSAYNESFNTHPTYASMPSHTLMLEVGDTHSDMTSYSKVRKAVKEILASHPSVTGVCPKPPKGFWKQ